MKSAAELAAVAFPQCSVECAALRELGACECDSICPRKFRPSKVARCENLSQRELDQVTK